MKLQPASKSSAQAAKLTSRGVVGLLLKHLTPVYSTRLHFLPVSPCSLSSHCHDNRFRPAGVNAVEITVISFHLISMFTLKGGGFKLLVCFH